jgi:hypothetical protein
MRHLTKKLLFVLVLLLPVQVCLAASTAEKNKTEEPVKPKAPKWSLELKAGLFEPEIDNWEQFYGDDKTKHVAGSVAYKVIQQIEIGMEGGWIRDRGKGFLPANGIIGGEVEYQLFPLNIFVLFRGTFSPGQLVVPYIGGGWSRVYYKQKITNQSNIDGAENGTHYRAGIQFLINNINKKAASQLKKSYGVQNSYFFLEVAELDVKTDSTNVEIGGTSYLAGFLMEF